MRVLAVLAAALLLATGLAVRPSAAHAATPTVVVQRTDPLMTDPVRLQVDVLGDDGTPAAFSGTVALAVGRTRSAVTVSGTGTAAAAVPTSALTGGDATMTARLTIGGAVRTVTTKLFATIVPSLAVAGFGCAAVPAKGGVVRWAVTRLNGDPVIAPLTRDRVPRAAYVGTTSGLVLMKDSTGAFLPTTGRMTILSGTKTVATVAAAKAVRHLVFGLRWNGRASGRFIPGVYTARLVLRDATGRTTTAEQTVEVVKAGALPCGL